MSANSKKGKIESNLNIQCTTKKGHHLAIIEHAIQVNRIELNVHEMKVNCSLERVVSQGERAWTVVLHHFP